MKILSYNINRSVQSKIDKVMRMGADIMVLPECACPEQVELPLGYSMEWMGIKERCDWKGLGVIWKDNIEVTVAPWYNENHKYILPLLVNQEFILLATWPTIIDKTGKTYPAILLDALKDYQDYLSSNPTIICGDFNCFIGQASPTSKTGSWEQCIDFMEKLGLHSLYHKRKNEEFGKETQPTYYHQFKEDMPFFLDYAFTNMDVQDYELGRWDKDMSDHCPQMIVL